MQQQIGGNIDRVLPWDRLPSDVDPSSIRSIRLMPTRSSSLPTFLPLLALAEYLSLPLRLLPAVSQPHLPPGLRVLWLDGPGSAVFPPDIELPTLEWLMAPQAAVVVHSWQLPALRVFFARVNPSAYALLEGLTGLRAASLGPYDDEGLLRILPPGIEYLQISGGKAPSISALDRLTSLTDLWLQQLTRLVTLDSLLQVPRLQELTIMDCKAITDVGVLGNLPHLRRLMVVGCGKIGLTPLLPVLRKKRLEELRIAGTT